VTRTALLRSTPMFASLSDDLLGQLAGAVETRIVPRGAIVVKQADEADSLFIVVGGSLEAVLELGADGDQRLDRLGPGSVLGEVALIVGGRRSATVRALEDSELLVLSRARFESFLERHPELSAGLTRGVHERTRRVAIARHLQELFGALDPKLLEQIERATSWRQLASGQVLFKQGEVADGAYIVALGRLRVSVADPGAPDGERIIDEVGPGQWIGEMALLTGRERSATVYAVRDSELLWLSQTVFDQLIVANPTALLETSRQLVTRLQRQMGAANPHGAELRTIAVIPASGAVDASWFTRQLVADLAGFGSVLHLTAATVDAKLGKPGIARVATDDPAQLRLARWLIEQEGAHHYVVYEADPKWTCWSDRTVRQADHILVVADGAGSNALGEAEAELAGRFSGGRAPQQSLVLLHAKTEPGYAGTASWLDRRKVDRHFHVRRGVTNDISRLVRILTDNAICLVFGGGGSRGYAHIGVVRACEELRIPIDAVAGSSIGAVIAAAYAAGLGSAQMLATCAPILARFLDPTLPVVSLMSGRRATEGVASVVGALEIEDLAIPMFCISTNLSRGGQVVHRRGSVVVATRASGSVPGIFPPVPWNGDLLVDGGLSNNIPVDVMASLYGGSIVAVDVIPDVDLKSSSDSSNYVSGWQALLGKVNPFSSRGTGMPSILSILMRSVTTASKSMLRGEERLTSLYLRPQVSRWNILDFKAAEPIAAEGYRGTVEPLRAWWKSEQAKRAEARSRREL
jgi:predicted acylesterase/phospholipase RssA/CRP-like cAMP-binding protein